VGNLLSIEKNKHSITTYGFNYILEEDRTNSRDSFLFFVRRVEVLFKCTF